ncbi:MAG: hypothetical protein MI861_09080, partial [Pirellulales bacterium]|nr:hypothetical protein [Pirellulales bacterium]
MDRPLNTSASTRTGPLAAGQSPLPDRDSAQSQRDVCLLILIDDIDQSVNDQEIGRQFDGDDVLVFDIRAEKSPRHFPQHWRVIDKGDVADSTQFRKDFIHFLESWPKLQLETGGSFDEVFRHRNGFSVWWTSIGSQRVPASSFVQTLQTIWWCAAALDRHRPAHVVVQTQQQHVRAAIVDWSERNNAKSLLNPASPAREPNKPANARLWLLRAMARQLVLPIRRIMQAATSRLLAKPDSPHVSPGKGGSIVFSSRLHRYFEPAGNQVVTTQWREISTALDSRIKDAKQYFLIRKFGHFQDCQWKSGLYNQGWYWLSRLPGSLPINEHFFSFSSYVKQFVKQLRLLWRYHQL